MWWFIPPTPQISRFTPHAIVVFRASMGTQNAQRDYLSAKEAAAIAKVSTTFLYNRIKKRSGPPHVRRGRCLRFPREEFIKWASQPVIL